MRYAYLKNNTPDSQGSRGGVTHALSDRYYGDEYELEIGQKQNASPELLALCVYSDEIMEFLEKCASPIGGMILSGIKKETKELNDRLTTDR